jgi:acetate kinase
MPAVAQRLPLPEKYLTRGLRRYGFHGLSYTSLQNSFRAIAGENAVNGRVIYAHLGSGVSLTATLHGKPVDTTMSFTPASGVMMSSRSGDMDPGIISYLSQEFDMDIATFTHMVHSEAGLLGVSGSSADMLTLLNMEHESPAAAAAVELFVYTIQKAIGSLTTTLNGIDSLVFSGGIGEKSAIIRGRVCDKLQYLGIAVDPDQNARSCTLISSPDSRAGVHVIATNEARVIATQALAISNQENTEKE